MEFVIISGLSGAGKSRAASIMEDMGFFCVDNLPAPLIPKFAELGMAGNGEYDRVVLVTDIRGGTRFDSLFQALDGLRAMQCAYSILFMEATDEVIIQRYKETRRSHPLADECDSLEEAIALERRMLSPLRERAAHIIDTSGLTARGLRAKLLQLFARGPAERSMEVRVTSFGFKHGAPYDAIINDVSGASEAVPFLASDEGIACARAHLTPGGLLMANCVVEYTGDAMYRLFSQVERLRGHFANVYVIDASDAEFGGDANYLLIATDGSYPFTGVIPYGD